MLICLATLPAILFTFYIAHNERNIALKRTEDEAYHLINLISREYLYQIYGAESLLQWLTDKLANKEEEIFTQDSEFLAALLAGYPQLGNIALLAPNGDVINSAYPLPGPINMRDYHAVQRAFHSKEIETGVYVIGPIVKRPLLHLAKAIRSPEGDVRWIMFVAIDLEWLNNLADQVKLPSEHTLLVLDRDGRVLANSSEPDSDTYSIGLRIPELAEFNRRDNNNVEARIGNRAHAFITAPMKEIPGVFIATEIPKKRIYNEANTVFYRTLGWLSLLTLCTVISVVLVEEIALLRYLRALSNASRKFGEGDYSARVSIPRGYGELKEMAKVFNTMAETLTHRHRELEDAHHQLDRLTRHLQVARESEARRIARDLHDEVGQVLTSIKMDLTRFQKKCSHKEISPRVDRIIEDSIGEMRSKIDDMVDFIRRIASDLRPPVLDRMGLLAAIELVARNLEQSSGLVVEIETTGIEEPVDWLLSITIYRIVQEAMTNISRHADATEVRIGIHKIEREIILTIRDNGQGIRNLDLQKESLGMIGMKERARLVNGSLSIESSPGQGTTLKAAIPLDYHGGSDAYPVGG